MQIAHEWQPEFKHLRREIYSGMTERVHEIFNGIMTLDDWVDDQYTDRVRTQLYAVCIAQNYLQALHEISKGIAASWRLGRWPVYWLDAYPVVHSVHRT